ncbi:MAG: hypothetical protein KDA89_24500, partial [Planctomycetaceae bacterium]|nr:hypothetical protein [Planctomycetaceae bacterium]
LSYGKDSYRVSQIAYDASRLGHPFFTLNRIRRVLARKASAVTSETDQHVVVRTSPFADPTCTKPDDFLELVFSKEYDLLPISMARHLPDEANPDAYFHSGAGIEIQYARELDGSLRLVSAGRDRRLKDDVEGILYTKWRFTKFDRSAEIPPDSLTLTLPHQVLAEDVDSGRIDTVTGSNDDVAGLLKKRFGNHIQFEPRVAAMRSVAASFVGRCPDLPPVYEHISRTSSVTGPKSPDVPGHRTTWLLAGHALVALGISIFRKRRRCVPAPGH